MKPGLEVETRETVHLVCLFDEAEQACSMQELVYAHLPCFPRTEGGRSLGSQVLADRRGMFVGYETRPLYAACTLSAERVAEEARQLGGLVLAAHVERRAHGLLGVLGFQPPDLELDGLEAGPGELTQGRVAGSDAHRLADMGRRFTVFETESAAVKDLRHCLLTGRYRAGIAL